MPSCFWEDSTDVCLMSGRMNHSAQTERREKRFGEEKTASVAMMRIVFHCNAQMRTWTALYFHPLQKLLPGMYTGFFDKGLPVELGLQLLASFCCVGKNRHRRRADVPQPKKNGSYTSTAKIDPFPVLRTYSTKDFAWEAGIDRIP